MSKMDQILENCLQAIERGDVIEAVLGRYPEYAEELRPILEVAVSAKNKTVLAIPAEVVRRNRAKVLQQAAEMREGQRKRRSTGIWFTAFRRVTVTFAVLAIAFASGAKLVHASSATLPGDNLYPVKRTWENVLVLVTFDSQKREYLELEQENERLEEMQELFAEGRSAPVDFSGLVTSKNSDQWMVAGINVLISHATRVPSGQISAGSQVRVIGQTMNGIVQAERIELLSTNEAATVDLSTPNPGIQLTPTSNSGETVDNGGSQSQSFKGIVQAINGHIWTINGVQVDVSNAEISGIQAVGSVADVEGYFNANGIFVVKRIEFSESSSGSDDAGTNDSGSDEASPSSTPQYDSNNNNSNDDDHEQVHATETPEPEHQQESENETPEPEKEHETPEPEH